MRSRRGRKGTSLRLGGFISRMCVCDRFTGSLMLIPSLFSQPDLPTRLERDIPLTAYDRSTFYLVGQNEPRGYTDHPFATVAAA
jgi:hypothetical protein